MGVDFGRKMKSFHEGRWRWRKIIECWWCEEEKWEKEIKERWLLVGSIEFIIYIYIGGGGKEKLRKWRSATRRRRSKERDEIGDEVKKHALQKGT